jgi:hypothetical protein
MGEEDKVISLANARERDKSQDKTTEKHSEKEQPHEFVYCSFCGRPNHMVIKMIKGPGVNICSECVMICVQYFILEDRIASADVQKVLDSFWRGVKK